ncbi:uncharacterized protein LOC102801689 [Saccoglossus kowalevskii]|uniref:Uncharacterized protein LOC102801689 n=1 Tax=Saccoglossus kowalevskii TaxID=10224 RepID=A0ABM0LVX0_SACKO|nr:PREDICTED: uncharacterized protein LOC102801689 [Saccoglossus kowalevskii]
MAQVMTRRSFAKRSDLDLMMECEDDDLSPAQRELFQTQLAEQRKYDAQVAKYNAEKAKQDQQVQILQQHHTVHSFSEMPRMVPNISMKGSNMRVTNQRTMLKTMLANKPSNIKTVTNASSIVQTIAKQIGTPTSGISPASNVGQSYILAPNSRTPIHLQAQGTSMVQQPIAVPSQPMNTSASAPSTRYIIQKSTPTVSLLSSQPLHSLAQTQPVNNSTQYQRYPAAQMQTIPQQSIINTNYGRH